MPHRIYLFFVALLRIISLPDVRHSIFKLAINFISFNSLFIIVHFMVIDEQCMKSRHVHQLYQFSWVEHRVSFPFFFFFLVIKCLSYWTSQGVKLTWQTTLEATSLLAGNNIKWFFGSGNQLYLYVVPPSNRRYHIQVWKKKIVSG